MQEDRNPYLNAAQEAAPSIQQPQKIGEQNPYMQQQAYYQQQPQQPQPPYYQQQQGQLYYPPQQNYQQQQPYYQQPYYPPNYPYARPRTRVPGRGAAKAFAIVSFVAGCFCLMAVLTLIVKLSAGSASGSASEFISDLFNAVIISAPGLVFGILAIVKKTNLMPMAILGTVFSGVYLFGNIILLTARI